MPLLPIFKPTRKKVMLSGAAFAALALFFACCGCGRKPATDRAEAPAKKPAPETAVQLKGSKVTIRWDDNAGKPLLEVSATEVSADEQSLSAVLKEPKALLYSDGTPAAVITSKIIEIDGSRKILTAGEGVVVKSAQNHDFAKADSVIWDSSRNLIEGRGNVAVVWRGFELRGDSFTADTALKRIEMKAANGKGRYSP